jgi:hypothetical protein
MPRVWVEPHDHGAPLTASGGDEGVHYDSSTGSFAGVGSKKPREAPPRGVKSSSFSLLDGVFKSVAGSELRHL